MRNGISTQQQMSEIKATLEEGMLRTLTQHWTKEFGKKGDTKQLKPY